MAKDDWLLERSTVVGLERVIEPGAAGEWCAELPNHKKLRCPVCSGTYQVVGAPERIYGAGDYGAGWGGRGEVTIVPVSCESGHSWEMCFGFHKGETFSFVRIPDEAERSGDG